MGLFNFFGDDEHRVFNYKPIYYDKKEDERRKMFGHVDGSLDKQKEKGEYVPGSYIKGAFREGGYQKTSSSFKSVHRLIGIVTLLLVFVVLYYIAKFYSLL